MEGISGQWQVAATWVGQQGSYLRLLRETDNLVRRLQAPPFQRLPEGRPAFPESGDLQGPNLLQLLDQLRQPQVHRSHGRDAAQERAEKRGEKRDYFAEVNLSLRCCVPRFLVVSS